MYTMSPTIRAWRKVLNKYANRKPYAQLQHTIGYLCTCEDYGALLPDPYIPQWRDVLRRLIPRASEEDQILLVSLYEELAAYESR